MNKLITFLILIILTTGNIFPQTGWQRYYPTPVTQQINNSYFANENSGWIISGNLLLRTTNGGANWDKKYTDSSYFGSMYFLNINTGWLITAYRCWVLKTTNGGNSWNKTVIDTSQANFLYSIYFINANTGWIGTNRGILKTTNSGINWIAGSIISGNINSLWFINNNTGFASCSTGIYSTTNGGDNWQQLNSLACYHLIFVNQLTGFASVSPNKIYKTTNAGLNWNMVFSGLTNSFTSFSFSDSLTVWAGGDRNGIVIKTTNGGNNWVQQQTNTYRSITFLNFFNANTGWFFTDRGDIFKTTNGGLNYFQQNNSLNTNLFGLYFSNNNTGYVSGFYDTLNWTSYRGNIFKTTNGGINWFNQLSGVRGTIYSINFPDINTGFAGSSNGTIWKTTNAGQLWDSTYSGDVNSINDFFFLNVNTGWAATNLGIRKTTNSGLNWILQNASADFECVYFLNENTGWTGGYWTTLIKTTNGGSNWVNQTLPVGFQDYVTSIYFFDENTGYAISLGYLCKTTDGGTNWNYNSYITDLYKMVFKGDKGWMIKANGGILRTTNRGDSWLFTYDSTDCNLNSIFFTDSYNGWIAGNNSVILKTTDGGVLVKKNETYIPLNYSIKQNYPNPFNPYTNIEFDLKESGTAKISVYDISGKEIEVLLNEELQPGIYKLMWDAGKYSSGIYFCKMEIKDFSKSIKMILLK